MDIRSQIYQEIASIVPVDPIEHAHLNFVLDWIRSGVEICRTEKPATPAIHLVSYFMVVSEDRDRVLLVDHKKAELWLPPGGHVEPGEHPRDTVTRESLEELDLEAEFISKAPLFVTVTETVGNVLKHTDVSIWYLLKGDPNVEVKFDPEEFNRVRWFALEEIPYAKSDPHMKRFIGKTKEMVKI